MLHELERSAEMQAQMRWQQVVVASNRHEAFEKGRALRRKGEMGIPADLAASMLGRILDTWLGDLNVPWTVLKGKTVLDLASGSTLSKDSFSTWHPHFSRLCTVNGAEVLALDANVQVGIDQQLFASAEVDLVDAVLGVGLPQLDAVRGRKFDIIHSANFVSSNPPDELLIQLFVRSTHTKDFEEKFFEQAGELLAEGGVMCLDIRDDKYLPIVYTKRSNQIVQIKRR